MRLRATRLSATGNNDPSRGWRYVYILNAFGTATRSIGGLNVFAGGAIISGSSVVTTTATGSLALSSLPNLTDNNPSTLWTADWTVARFARLDLGELKWLERVTIWGGGASCQEFYVMVTNTDFGSSFPTFSAMKEVNGLYTGGGLAVGASLTSTNIPTP